MPRSNGKDMTLRITRCVEMYSGHNTRGDAYTIYDIEAEKPDGQKINENLRSFASLPVGQEVEVTVVPFNSDRHGRSFTVHQKNRDRASTTQAVNDLAKRLEALAESIDLLAGRVAMLEREDRRA